MIRQRPLLCLLPLLLASAPARGDDPDFSSGGIEIFQRKPGQDAFDFSLPAGLRVAPGFALFWATGFDLGQELPLGGPDGWEFGLGRVVSRIPGTRLEVVHAPWSRSAEGRFRVDDGPLPPPGTAAWLVSPSGIPGTVYTGGRGRLSLEGLAVRFEGRYSSDSVPAAAGLLAVSLPAANGPPPSHWALVTAERRLLAVRTDEDPPCQAPIRDGVERRDYLLLRDARALRLGEHLVAPAAVGGEACLEPVLVGHPRPGRLQLSEEGNALFVFAAPAEREGDVPVLAVDLATMRAARETYRLDHEKPEILCRSGNDLLVSVEGGRGILKLDGATRAAKGLVRPACQGAIVPSGDGKALAILGGSWDSPVNLCVLDAAAMKETFQAGEVCAVAWSGRRQRFAVASVKDLSFLDRTGAPDGKRVPLQKPLEKGTTTALALDGLDAVALGGAVVSLETGCALGTLPAGAGGGPGRPLEFVTRAGWTDLFELDDGLARGARLQLGVGGLSALRDFRQARIPFLAGVREGGLVLVSGSALRFRPSGSAAGTAGKAAAAPVAWLAGRPPAVCEFGFDQDWSLALDLARKDPALSFAVAEGPPELSATPGGRLVFACKGALTLGGNCRVELRKDGQVVDEARFELRPRLALLDVKVEDASAEIFDFPGLGVGLVTSTWNRTLSVFKRPPAAGVMVLELGAQADRYLRCGDRLMALCFEEGSIHLIDPSGKRGTESHTLPYTSFMQAAAGPGGDVWLIANRLVDRTCPTDSLLRLGFSGNKVSERLFTLEWPGQAGKDEVLEKDRQRLKVRRHDTGAGGIGANNWTNRYKPQRVDGRIVCADFLFGATVYEFRAYATLPRFVPLSEREFLYGQDVYRIEGDKVRMAVSFPGPVFPDPANGKLYVILDGRRYVLSWPGCRLLDADLDPQFVPNPSIQALNDDYIMQAGPHALALISRKTGKLARNLDLRAVRPGRLWADDSFLAVLSGKKLYWTALP